MKILPPVSIEARRLLPSRWDLLAAILVLGFIVAFADASRFLVHPLSSITGHDLTLNLLDLPGYRIGKRGIAKAYDNEVRGDAGTVRDEVDAHGRVIKELGRADGAPGQDVWLTIEDRKSVV